MRKEITKRAKVFVVKGINKKRPGNPFREIVGFVRIIS